MTTATILKCEVKSEIITIDDDYNGDIPYTKGVKIKNLESSSGDEGQNGIFLRYIYEPQSSSASSSSSSAILHLATSIDQKTDNEKVKNVLISCPSCPASSTPQIEKVYESKSSFDSHYRNIHKDEILYGCASCNSYNTKKFVLLKNHFKKHLELKKYKCTECLNEFAQKSELNNHKISEHNLKICRKCNLEFSTFERYLAHKESHGSLQMSKNGTTTKAGIECSVCGKVLMTQGGMMTHRKMHSESPKYRCEQCQKEFFQKVNLINHAKTHNIQNRSYSCNKCDKKFFEKSHLQRHQNFHNVSREFECSTCHKFYKTERCLKVHKQVHNPMHMRPFRCAVDGCTKTFLSSSKLKQHGNIHTNTRPFQCKHCPRDFTNYPNLLKHTIRRHKVDHRTGKPLDKIPDYVTNKKKKKANVELTFPKIQDKPLPTEEPNNHEQPQHELANFNVISHDEFPLPSTSGLIERDFRLDDDGDGAIQSYDSMSILMDIDQEFSDFQLLSPNASCHENNEDDIDQQFSIIDTTDLQFFSGENSINAIQLVGSND